MSIQVVDPRDVGVDPRNTGVDPTGVEPRNTGVDPTGASHFVGPDASAHVARHVVEKAGPHDEVYDDRLTGERELPEDNLREPKREVIH